MENLRKFFTKDRFAEYVGIELIELSAGKAKVQLKIEKKHLNGVDLVHGGTIFSLADFAFAVACRCPYPVLWNAYGASKQ